MLFSCTLTQSIVSLPLRPDQGDGAEMGGLLAPIASCVEVVRLERNSGESLEGPRSQRRVLLFWEATGDYRPLCLLTSHSRKSVD